MNITTLKRIFEFIEEKGEHRTPLKFKLLNNVPLTKEELIVDDDLFFFNSKIISLPEGLKVGGNLMLGFSKIESLPEGLKVDGYLNLSDCKKLTSLPKGLKVGSFLNIADSALTKYTDEEIREMIKPGFIKEKIYR